MIRIRPEQMQAFAEAADAAFVGELAARLRDTLPDETAGLDGALLKRRVRLAVSRARLRGFMRESEVAVFAGLMFAIGPHVEDWPAVAAILGNQSLTVQQRIAALQRIPDTEWEDARAVDSAAWDEETGR